MAEAVALVASVITIIQLTGAVTALGYRYIASIKRAPDDVQQLVDELAALGKVLTAVRTYADKYPNSTTLDLLNDQNGPLRGCAEELNKLQAKLQPKVGFKGVVENFKWPFKENETLQHISRLERHKNLFVFALTADQMSLSRVIEAYVENIDLAVQEIAKCTRDTTQVVEDIRHELRSEVVTQTLRRGQADTLLKAKKRQKVLNWLFPGPFDERHLEISRRRQQKTGSWLFEKTKFLAWVEGQQPLLWGHGIPGAGKTFLSSLVIDFLLAQAIDLKSGVAYIYFDYQEQKRQTPDTVLASLIRQLATQIPHSVEEVEILYDRLGEKDMKPTFQEKYTALVATFKWFSRVFFVFDALDECHQENQRDELLPLFQRLCEDGASIFLTSRPHPEDIQIHLSEVAKIELSAQDGDIECYVEAKINKNPRARRLVQQSGCRDKIISELKDCANGMFLIVHFHIAYLCQQPTAKKMFGVLDTLKTLTSEERPLDPTYERAMKSIHRQPKSCRELAIRVISWLLKARRTLSVHELQVAVSVELGEHELGESDLPDAITLLDVCAGLVTIDSCSNDIRFSHFTVQEYLIRNFKCPPDVDRQVAMACITYLAFDFMAEGACNSHEALKNRISSHVFLQYSASNARFHLSQYDEDLSTDVVLKFARNPAVSSSYIQIVYFNLDERIISGSETPLHIAVSLGHCAAVRSLLAESTDLSAVNRMGEATPLAVAAMEGHKELVKLLLDNGADLSVGRRLAESPLTLAAKRGHEPVVRLLMDYGADISAKDYKGDTPLLCAVLFGHEPIVKLLLDNGADPSAVDSKGNTALMLATSTGSEALVMMLLRRGADPLVQNKLGYTVLESATLRGQEAMLLILLNHGANLSFVDKNGNTTLHIAAIYEQVLAAKLLLQGGADPSIPNNNGETPLSIAVASGHDEISQLLISAMRS